MLGHLQGGYHLEFTFHAETPITAPPSAEQLLVFYIPEKEQWKASVQRIESLGCHPNPAANPYWDLNGRTYLDPDGYRIVLQNAAWAPRDTH